MTTLAKTSAAEYLLVSAFEELETYVAVDLAKLHCNLNADDRKQRPRWYKLGFYWRPDLGIKHLEANSVLLLEDGTLSNTAKLAIEIKALYDWYQARKSREELEYDYEKQYGAVPDKLVDAADKIVKAWIAEDQKMLRRLVDIRPELWT